MTDSGREMLDEAGRRTRADGAEAALVWLDSLEHDGGIAANVARARVLVALDRRPDALEAYRRAVFRPDPADLDVLQEFASLAVELFALDEARMVYRELMFRPGGARAGALGLWRLERLGAQPRARHLVRTVDLKAGLILEPSDPLMWLELGSFESKRGAMGPAERSLRRCLSSLVGDPRFWRRLAVCSSAREDWPATRTLLRRAAALEPGEDPGAWQSLCETFIRLREPARAQVAFRAASALFAGRLTGKKRAAFEGLEHEIQRIVEEQNRRRRIYGLRRWLVEDPAGDRVWLELAQTALAVDKRKLAMRALRHLEVFPSLAAKRARVGIAIGDPTEVIRSARRLLAITGADTHAMIAAAQTFEAAGDTEQAGRWARALLCVTRQTEMLVAASAVLQAVDRPMAGVPAICAATAAAPRDYPLRMELSRLVGAAVRQLFPYEPGVPAEAPRLIDCFPFNNEHELLLARLELLYPHVDRFVLVEAPCTFTGASKPLHFAENRDRYAAYLDKIVHVVVEPHAVMSEPWARDFFQRDSLIRGLNGYAAPDDLIVVADLDEFWDPAVLRQFSGEFAALRMRLSQGKINHRPVFGKRVAYDAGAICRFRVLEKVSPSLLRFETVRDWSKAKGEWIDDAGWHLTSVGDFDFVKGKLDSYAHQEPTKRRRFTEGVISARMERLSRSIPDEDWVLFARERRWPKALQKALARTSLWQAPRSDMLSAAVFDVTDDIDRLLGRRWSEGHRNLKALRGRLVKDDPDAEAPPPSALSRLADDPDDRVARHEVVLRYWEEGRRVDALALLEAGLRRDPLNADLQAIKGFLLLRAGSVADAKQALRRVLLLQPAHAKVRRRMVLSLDAQGRIGEAATELARLGICDPGDQEFANDMLARWERATQPEAV